MAPLPAVAARVRGQLHGGEAAKRTLCRRRAKEEEMRQEYRFDYSKSRPNRFASLTKAGTVAIVLDPDVASVFRSSESVNSVLRSVFNALSKNTKV